jgi:hypothetical protein
VGNTRTLDKFEALVLHSIVAGTPSLDRRVSSLTTRILSEINDLAQPDDNRLFLQIIFLPRRDIDGVHAEDGLYTSGMHRDLSRKR